MSEFEEILRNHPNLLLRLVYIADLGELEVYGDVNVDAYAAMLEEAEALGDPEDPMYSVAQRVREKDETGMDELLVQMAEVEF